MKMLSNCKFICVLHFSAHFFQAFSGRVLETSKGEQSMKIGSKPDGDIKEGNPNLRATDEPPKRISKFKASRLAEQGFS